MVPRRVMRNPAIIRSPPAPGWSRHGEIPEHDPGLLPARAGMVPSGSSASPSGGSASPAISPLSVHPPQEARAETGTTIKGPPIDSTQTREGPEASSAVDEEVIMHVSVPSPTDNAPALKGTQHGERRSARSADGKQQLPDSP